MWMSAFVRLYCFPSNSNEWKVYAFVHVFSQFTRNVSQLALGTETFWAEFFWFVWCKLGWQLTYVNHTWKRYGITVLLLKLRYSCLLLPSNIIYGYLFKYTMKLIYMHIINTRACPNICDYKKSMIPPISFLCSIIGHKVSNKHSPLSFTDVQLSSIILYTF